jgi:hypothetical protein
MGLPGMVLSALSTVAGAILYWGVTAQSSSTALQHGFRLSTLGIILMVAGAVGFVTSSIVYVSSRRSLCVPSRTLDREAVDAHGSGTLMHERQN